MADQNQMIAITIKQLNQGEAAGTAVGLVYLYAYAYTSIMI